MKKSFTDLRRAKVEAGLITDIHREVIRLDTQDFHPKKYIRRRLIRRNLLRLKGLVMDIGCGRGEDPPFMRNARRVIGYDLDVEILKYYRLKNGLDAIAGNAIAVPFKNESFDSISSIDVLEHIPDYKKAISESFRLLRKGGTFITSVPTNPRLFSKRDMEIGHLRLFDSEEFMQDIKDAGFRILAVKKYGTLIYPYVKYIANKMSMKQLHKIQSRKNFSIFKAVFRFFFKPLLKIDYYIPQLKEVGILVVATK